MNTILGYSIKPVFTYNGEYVNDYKCTTTVINHYPTEQEILTLIEESD